MKGKISVVLTGVGGQGVITAANILGKAALATNTNVFVSEVHGMAQRGGSVICTVRIGNVFGPLVPRGAADVLMSTEPIEALRYIQYANKTTIIITDSSPVIPYTVSVGLQQYPEIKDIFYELDTYAELYIIDAFKIATEAGASITKNIVMLGALAATGILPFTSDILLKTILNNVPTKYMEINKRAYNGGTRAVKKQ